MLLADSRVADATSLLSVKWEFSGGETDDYTTSVVELLTFNGSNNDLYSGTIFDAKFFKTESDVNLIWIMNTNV